MKYKLSVGDVSVIRLFRSRHWLLELILALISSV